MESRAVRGCQVIAFAKVADLTNASGSCLRNLVLVANYDDIARATVPEVG
jgi:hypothetical protein